MSEQDDVIDRLRDLGVTDAIRWAFESAARRALEMYSEADGHTMTLFGQLRHTLFCDRLDRVFSCRKYGLGKDEDSLQGLDIVYAQLGDEDIATMPQIDPSLVSRKDLNQSPGWVCGDLRFLLSSSDPGEIDFIHWPAKSPTKERVARQVPVEEDGTALFGLSELGVADYPPSEDALVNFVVAHSINADTCTRELVFGRPRMSVRSEPSWHWRENLLSGAPSHRGGRAISADSMADAEPNSAVPDAPVRLRKGAAETPSNEATGS